MQNLVATGLEKVKGCMQQQNRSQQSAGRLGKKFAFIAKRILCGTSPPPPSQLYPFFILYYIGL